MSNWDEQKWKEKVEQLCEQLKQKDRVIKEYQAVIEQSNHSLKEVMDKLSMELKLANQMHRVLLPVELPLISGCEFSSKFRGADLAQKGKDFYAVVPHPTSRSFSIIMSSCFSHSLSALLVSARLKIMSGFQTPNIPDPVHFVNLLSAEIQKDIKNVSFKNSSSIDLENNIDLFYGVVNQKTYNLSYCFFGKMSVFIHSASNTRELHPTMQSVYNVKSHVVSLNSKDRLVVCSPGILNAQSPSGQRYSLLSLKQLIQKGANYSVHELRNNILYELDHFCQGHPRQRDQTVLVMSIKDRILKKIV